MDADRRAETRRVDIPAKVDGIGEIRHRRAPAGHAVRRGRQLPRLRRRGSGASTTARRGSCRASSRSYRSATPVAVVADTTWRAKAALARLHIVWDNGADAALDERGDRASRSRPRSAEPEGRGGGRFRRRLFRRGEETDRRLRVALSRPCPDGADELHRRGRPRPGRDLGADPGAEPGLDRRRQGGGRLEADKVTPAHDLSRRRLRPAAGGRLSRPGGQRRQGDRQAGAGHLVARGGHASTISIVRPRSCASKAASTPRASPSPCDLATASQSILARMFPPATWLGPDFTQFEGTVALALRDRQSSAAEVATIETSVPVG